LQGYDRLFGAFFSNIKISTNRPTSTSQKIGNQPLIIKSVVKDKYMFISIDLNRQGYKSEPFMLAKYVAQVFYVPNITNKRLKMVIPIKRWIIKVENAVDEEEFNQYDEIPPFISSMIKPRIPSANKALYLCNDHHENVKNFKKLRLQ
jgi:hypothetical protein